MKNNNASITIFCIYAFSQEAEVFSEYKNQENIVESVKYKHLLAIFYIYPLYFIKILLF